MLISENDVENYKQIKSDLDELRLLVEKSELWVSKEKVEKKKKKDASGNGTVKEEVMQHGWTIVIVITPSNISS